MKRKGTIRWISAGLVMMTMLTVALPSCSSRAGLKVSDIRSSEDSIVVGRLSVRLGSDCKNLVDLPKMELRNVGQRTCTTYQVRDLALTEKDERIELPIAQKVAAGTYDLRIKVVEGSWDPTWLDAGMLTLARFEVPRGFLVYFGTVKIDVTCDQFGKQVEARYADHTLADEHEFELNLFREDHPEIYQLYHNKIIQSVPERPWKRS